MLGRLISKYLMSDLFQNLHIFNQVVQASQRSTRLVLLSMIEVLKNNIVTALDPEVYVYYSVSQYFCVRMLATVMRL